MKSVLLAIFITGVTREVVAWHPSELGSSVFSAGPTSLRQAEKSVRNVATTEVKLPVVVGEVPATGLFHQLQFSTSNTLAAYIASACIIAGVIVALYWDKGWLVISRIILYLLALSTMKLSVKKLFVEFGFNYPKFVTAAHFFSGAIVASIVLLLRSSPTTEAAEQHQEDLIKSWREVCQPDGHFGAQQQTKLAHRNWQKMRDSLQKLSKQLGVPTLYEFWFQIVPISMGFAVSVAANNAALLFSSAAFTEIVGATGPVVSIGLIVLMGMPFDMRLLWPTLLVVAGCSLSTSGEVNFSGLGMALCFISILGRAFKTTLQQRIMTGTSKAKYDPVTLLAWMCLPSAAVMMTWSLTVEGLAPFAMLQESDQRGWLYLFLGISCVNACILNLSNLFCTKDLGAVGIQLVAQTKSVLTVLGAVALFHEAVTPIEVVGFIGVLIGVYLFSSMEKASPKA